MSVCVINVATLKLTAMPCLEFQHFCSVLHANYIGIFGVVSSKTHPVPRQKATVDDSASRNKCSVVIIGDNPVVLFSKTRQILVVYLILCFSNVQGRSYVLILKIVSMIFSQYYKKMVISSTIKYIKLYHVSYQYSFTLPFTSYIIIIIIIIIDFIFYSDSHY